MRELRLNGKTALVTGGSRGIGRAICETLASEGAFVLVHFNQNRNTAEQLVNDITKRGGTAALVQADLAQMAGVSECVRQVESILLKHGLRGLDVLVNNAGIGAVCAFEETSEDLFGLLFSLNVKAPFFLTQKLLSQINDGGRIINLSSVVARMALPRVGAYSMTKGAINTLTLWLAAQLGPRRITVNAVAPGVTDTDMNAPALSDPQSRKYIESLSVFGRVGVPKDVADAVAFLASDEGRWVTGQCIDVSGGTHL